MESRGGSKKLMKLITERQYNELTISILKDREIEAEKNHKSFNGIDGNDLLREITARLDDSWKVINEQPMKFTRADINAVASARYFRKGGITLLMGLLIVLLLVAIGVKSLVIMTPLYYNMYYTFCGMVALGFIWIYSHKQSKIRKELWRQLGREETLEK